MMPVTQDSPYWEAVGEPAQVATGDGREARQKKEKPRRPAMSRESSDGEDSVVGAGTDRFVDATAEAEVELCLPLEVDMELDRDVPSYQGVVNLGVVGPEVDTQRRFEPKPNWARHELSLPRTPESRRRMLEIDARPGKLVDNQCAF